MGLHVFLKLSQGFQDFKKGLDCDGSFTLVCKALALTRSRGRSMSPVGVVEISCERWSERWLGLIPTP